MRLLSILVIAASALTVQAADLPAVNPTPSADYFPGKFIWADLFTTDQMAATKFYTGLFGWTAMTIDRTTKDRGPKSYVILFNGDRPVAGIAERPAQLKEETRGHWVGYVSVTSVPGALAAATAGGGKVLFPAKDLPQRGAQAIFTDREGAMLGVMHSSSGDPGEYRPDAGDWTWAELFSGNPDAASKYYHSVLGYDAVADSRLNRNDTFLLTSGGYSRASVAPLPPDHPNARPGWLGFVRVNNINDTVSQAAALGGKILVPAKQAEPGTWIAIVADPMGAAVGIVQLDETNPASTAKGQP